MSQNRQIDYPFTKRELIIDNYHGTLVADPYRWLEDPDAQETKDWVNAQNRLTSTYLSNFPERTALKDRMKSLWNYIRCTPPINRGKRYFYQRNEGLQNQSILYMQEGIDGQPEILLDPNTLSADGTTALTGEYYSKDGRYLAYALAGSGSDWQEIYVRDVDTKRDMPEVLHWSKFSGIAWKQDNSGFYYSRYPETTAGTVADQTMNNKVYWHQLHTSQQDDQLVYERPDDPELGFSAVLTTDNKYLILYVWRGSGRKNRLYYCQNRDAMPSVDAFVKLLDTEDAKYDFIESKGSTFFVMTDKDAPKGRVVAIDLDHPAPDMWKTVIPEQSDTIESARMINNQLVISYLHDAYNQVKVFDLDGHPDFALDLPNMGSVIGPFGEKDSTEMFIHFTSFLFPPTVFRYDFLTKKLSAWFMPSIDFDISQYETRQIFYPSKDGTKVPMFLTHKKGLPLAGQNPVILYGYGGFDVNQTPMFSIVNLVFLEQGGVYAVANLRGGGEYGLAWHQAGMFEKKQNVFDDFIAAGEWLIANKYTTSKKLAIRGGSNGGLLVAACMVQRPDLFGAIICQVPVTDMLRYHRFTVGRYWTSEYGNAEKDPAHFKFMYAYSPINNVKLNVIYPPTLIMTADHDDRVVPAHAYKFGAAVQAADAGLNPILLRVETKAGHGLGKPTAKLIEEAVDQLVFLRMMFDSDPSL